MERRIEIDGLTYICHVSHDGETEYWSVSNANELAEFLKKQGYKVTRIVTETCPQSVWVDKNIRIFNDDPYFLNQCEGDLIEWIDDSMCGDFTNYYDKVLFNTEDGFIAAYRDDISNNWKF